MSKGCITFPNHNSTFDFPSFWKIFLLLSTKKKKRKKYAEQSLLIIIFFYFSKWMNFILCMSRYLSSTYSIQLESSRLQKKEKKSNKSLLQRDKNKLMEKKRVHSSVIFFIVIPLWVTVNEKQQLFQSQQHQWQSHIVQMIQLNIFLFFTFLVVFFVNSLGFSFFFSFFVSVFFWMKSWRKIKIIFTQWSLVWPNEKEQNAFAIWVHSPILLLLLWNCFSLMKRKEKYLFDFCVSAEQYHFRPQEKKTEK